MVIIREEKILSCDSIIAGKREDYPYFDSALKKIIELTKKNKKEYHFTFNDDDKQLTSNIIEGCETSVNPCISEDNIKSISVHSHYDEIYECMPSPADIWEDFVELNREKLLIVCPSENKLLTVHNPHFDEKTKSFIRSLVTDVILKRGCKDMDEKRKQLIVTMDDNFYEIFKANFFSNMEFSNLE